MDWKRWIDRFREGRGFVTNAPLLTFTVNGEPLGAVIRVANGRPYVYYQRPKDSLHWLLAEDLNAANMVGGKFRWGLTFMTRDEPLNIFIRFDSWRELTRRGRRLLLNRAHAAMYSESAQLARPCPYFWRLPHPIKPLG